MSLHIPDNIDDDAVRNRLESRLRAFRNNDPGRCPSAEQLVGYRKKEISGKMRTVIEDHISLCPYCLEALEALSSIEEIGPDEGGLPDNWPFIEKKMDEKFYAGVRGVSPPEKPKEGLAGLRNIFSGLWQGISETILLPKRLVYAGAFTVLAALSIYSFAYFNRDLNFYLARIEPEERINLRAENIHSALAEGLRLYDGGKYEASIAQLETFLEKDRNSYTAYYYLGLGHLSRAEATLLGLAYKYDDSEAEKGINSLSRALQLSQGNSYYLADCYWYTGKAWLMRGDREKARRQFLKILELDHPAIERKDEARVMISAIDGFGSR